MNENQKQGPPKRSGYRKNLSRSFTLSIGFHVLLLLLSLLSLGRFAQELGSGDGGDLGRGDFQQAALVGLSINLEAPASAAVPPTAATPAAPEDKTQVPPEAHIPPAEVATTLPDEVEEPTPDDPVEVSEIVDEEANTPPQSTPLDLSRVRESDPNDSDIGDADLVDSNVGSPASGQDGDSENQGDPGGDGGKIPEMVLDVVVSGGLLGIKNGSGVFVLQSLVGKDGRVLKVRVIESTDDCDECRKAAIEAAFKYEYVPGRVNGKLVEAWMTIELDFDPPRRR